MMHDHVLPFSVENTSVRGQIVRLGPALDDVLGRHDYPAPVSRILGEALLLTTMLGAALKFEGKLTLQLQGDGPVRMVVADYQTAGTLRGMVQIDEEELDLVLADRVGAKESANFKDLMGQGHLAFTIDQGPDMERYQGIVPLTGADLTACALVYFGQSEQILTAVKLSVAELFEPGGRHSWRGGGLLIQLLPAKTDEDREVSQAALDDWERLSMLMQTTEDLELIDPALASERLLYRLFHEDGVRVFDARRVTFSCQCSREKIRRILMSFDESDLKSMSAEGEIEARCEFCNTLYTFEPDEILSQASHT